MEILFDIISIGLNITMILLLLEIKKGKLR